MRRLALAFLVACSFQVPVEDFVVPLDALRLGETDFAQLIGAVDTIRFSGTAQMREGRFPISAESYALMDIEPDTEVEFEARVSVSATTRNERLVITPMPRTFRVHFSNPIVLHGRNDSRRVVLNGASLAEEDDGQFDVDVRVGKTLMGSIASAIVGVPSGLEESPGAFDMLARVEVSELQTTLRAGSVLRHGESELHVSEASGITLKRIDVNVVEDSAHLEVEGALRLGAGTCFASDEARLCVDDVELLLRGDYTRGPSEGAVVQRLRLSQLDSPSRITTGPGRVEWTDGTEAIEVRGAQFEFRRYECSEREEQRRCAFEIGAELQAGPGELALQGHALGFQEMLVKGVRLSDSGDEGAVRVEEVTLRDPRIGGPEGSLGFTALSIRGLQGSRWGALTLGSGSMVASPGTLEVGVGDTRLQGELTGETRIQLQQGAPLTLQPTDERAELRVRAEVDGAVVRVAGAVVAQATGLELDAVLDATTTRAELRIREDVRVDPSAVVPIAMGDVRLGFRAVRLLRDETGARVVTEGLRLALPQEDVLSNLQLHVPPTYTGEEQPLEGRIETLLVQVVGNPLQGELSHFRSRLDASRLDSLNMSFDRGRLRIRGNVDATLNILATERRSHLAECTHQVRNSLPVPCFDENSLPSICQREVEVEVPYPCLESEEVDATVLSGSVTIGIDVSGGVTSNAPATLAALELKAAVARCDRINVRGMNGALQRALDIEGTVCSHLSQVEQTFALGSILDIETSDMLASARVERLDFDTDDTDLIIGLDLNVPIEATSVETPPEEPIEVTAQ